MQLAAGLAEGARLRGLLDRLLEPVVALAGGGTRARCACSANRASGCNWSATSACQRRAPLRATVDRGCGICGDAAGARGASSVWSSDLRVCAERSGDDFFDAPASLWWPMPLQRRGRAMLGVYNLFFADEARRSPQVMALLRSVGELLGPALDNARLEAQSVRASGDAGSAGAMAAEIRLDRPDP